MLSGAAALHTGGKCPILSITESKKRHYGIASFYLMEPTILYRLCYKNKDIFRSPQNKRQKKREIYFLFLLTFQKKSWTLHAHVVNSSRKKREKKFPNQFWSLSPLEPLPLKELAALYLYQLNVNIPKSVIDCRLFSWLLFHYVSSQLKCMIKNNHFLKPE